MFEQLDPKEIHLLKRKLSAGYWRLVNNYGLYAGADSLNRDMWEMAADIHDTFRWVARDARKG